MSELRWIGCIASVCAALALGAGACGALAGCSGEVLLGRELPPAVSSAAGEGAVGEGVSGSGMGEGAPPIGRPSESNAQNGELPTGGADDDRRDGYDGESPGPIGTGGGFVGSQPFADDEEPPWQAEPGDEGDAATASGVGAPPFFGPDAGRR